MDGEVGEDRRGRGDEGHLDGAAGARPGSGRGGVPAGGAVRADVEQDAARDVLVAVLALAAPKATRGVGGAGHGVPATIRP